jgi:mono/diheme cytochrome c family protein
MKTMLITFICGVLVLPVPAFANGESDYNASCAGCHGAKGYVQTEKAKALNMDVRKLALKASTKNKNEMTAVIEKGAGKMPSFEKQLTKEQISAIVDYIMSLQKK